MIGFLILFVAAVVALFLVVQGTYRKTELFASYPVLDEILGGVLGVVQGLLLLLFLTIILDQYFLLRADGGRDGRAARSCGPSGTAIDELAVRGGLPPDRDPGVPRPGRRSCVPELLEAAYDAVVARRRQGRRHRRSPACSSPGTRSTPPGRCSVHGWFATRTPGRGRRVGRIVEVEAYIGRGGPRIARAHGSDGAQPGHVRAAGHRLRVPCLRHAPLSQRRDRGRPVSRGAAHPRRRARSRASTAMRAARAARPAARQSRMPALRPDRDSSALAFGIDRSPTGLDLCDRRSALRLESRPAAERRFRPSSPRPGSGSPTRASRGCPCRGGSSSRGARP